MTEECTNEPAEHAVTAVRGSEARGAFVIALGQTALMASGGVLALLITRYFGRGAGTDAFFTAYGLYVIAIAFAQTLRLTVLPQLMGDVSDEQESRLVSAAVGMALVAAVPMIVFADPFAGLIANGDPTGVAERTLRLLWPALACHLLAGVLIPMLTVRGIYAPVGAAYTFAGVTSVITLVMLQPELGLDAVSTGLALGAFLLAISLVLTLSKVSRGLKPRAMLRAFIDLRRLARDGCALIIASASFLVVNVGYLICLIVANHGSRGSATIYAYAFFAAAFLVASTAIPSAMVRAPRLLEGDGSRGISGYELVSEYRLMLLLLTPAYGLAALATTPAIEFVAGEFFGDGAATLTATLFALAPWVLASSAGVIVVLHLLNRSGSVTLAYIAVGQIVLLAPAAVIGRLLGGIEGIAIAQSLTMVVATATQIRWALRPHHGSPMRELCRLTIEMALIGLVSFGPTTLFMAIASPATIAVIPLSLASFAAYGAIVHRRHPREWRALRSIVKPHAAIK